jgi:hypothetical protein
VYLGLSLPSVFIGIISSPANSDAVTILNDLRRSYFSGSKALKCDDISLSFDILITQACFASLVSQDYVSGTDQEEIRTGKNALFVGSVFASERFLIADFTLVFFSPSCILRELFSRKSDICR